MEANEAMKGMARRCAAKYWQTGDPGDEAAARSILSGEWDDQAYTQAALAAIIETQARDAALADAVAIKRGHANADVLDLATAIRAGEHYALAGDRHG
ncbi:hypothetical protein [Sphingopyxis sp. 22461]|uniref:hypothetical protein n=1 Tax=Sphingopyxis sp. 22461 TaxID=3453923 RepID=UPI003F86449F